ncbi:MAG: hypothetical protein GX594_04745 [Pirellulaceae bacterium]|nr:hypothetical protein [Pirellulaceae bacterium]
MKRPAKKSKRPPRPREKVLIVMHPGGLVEIFAMQIVEAELAEEARR